MSGRFWQNSIFEIGKINCANKSTSTEFDLPSGVENFMSMNLSLVLAVSGKPDLFKMVANRSNGLIVENLKTGKSNFISARKHQFTPLESISIYTLEDTIPLKDVFGLLKKHDHSKIPVSGSSNEEIEQFFDQVVPDYDEDKVHVRDMKKVFRWYLFLHEKGMLEEKPSDEEE